MLLVERGQLDLEQRVQTYLPEFKGDGKEAITIRQLMTHTSGLRPDISTQPAWSGYDTAIHMACAEKLVTPPGTAFRYSDINFFLLGEVVRRVSGMKLNEFVEREVYRPLKMVDTAFRPIMTSNVTGMAPDSSRRNPGAGALPAGGVNTRAATTAGAVATDATTPITRIAPTEGIDNMILRGVVHDPTARYMGGVAGHAGLFTTAADLARYVRMLLNLGELDGVRLFRPETVRLMTSVQTPDNIPARRGLGWDIDSAYSRPRGKIFPLGSYGHTGFTGTALWIDPFSKTFWILLSNRVHPYGRGSVLALESALANLAAEAVVGFNFSYIPGSLPPRPTEEPSPPPEVLKTVRVLDGIDVLVKQKFAPLKGLRVGLVTNQTGHDRGRNSTIDLLRAAGEVQLKALFSPEHGIRGALDEPVSDTTDEKTGLPVYSLYGTRRAPEPEQLRDLWFDQTELPWTNPSPNMRNLEEAILYPGVGLLESALSVGRGTDMPFEIIGAPYIDDVKLAGELNRGGLTGVRFVPVRFTPKASV